MKHSRFRIALFLFCVLSLVNAYFFFHRNKIGSYTRVGTYGQLYAQPYSENDLIKWQKTLSPYSTLEIEEARKISFVEVGVRETDPTVVKIEKIGKWLAGILHECPRGQPDSSLVGISLTELLNVYKQRKTPVWCGTYAPMFALYCAVNGITVRSIETISNNNNANHHALNECFIRETGKWAMTDLTHNILYAKDDQNNLLNTIDVINYQHENNKIIPVFAVTSEDSGTYAQNGIPTEWKKYLGYDVDLYYYYLTELSKIYSPVQKIKRYVLPVSWYELYTKQPVSNLWFYLRQFLLVIWLIVLIFMIINIPRRKKI